MELGQSWKPGIRAYTCRDVPDLLLCAMGISVVRVHDAVRGAVSERQSARERDCLERLKGKRAHPALLNMTSNRPNSLTARSTVALISSSFETSTF